MKTKKPLVNKECLLEKFQGKGGWTFARIPEILPDIHSPFGWVRVRGTIDDFEIKGYHLMPMGNDKLFLPVKAEIRKKIGKQEGDYVRIILFADRLPKDLPEELKQCLLDEPNAYQTFLNCTEDEQRAFIKRIYSAKTDEIKVSRIAELLDKLAQK